MTTKGDWAQVDVNGLDLTGHLTGATYHHKVGKNQTQPQNVGVQQYVPGAFDPAMTLEGYRLAPNPNSQTAHNLLAVAKGVVGSSIDIELIASLLYGNGNTPVAGDIAALMSATLLNYDPQQIKPDDVFRFVAQFQGRGKRPALGNLILNQGATTTGTITSAFYDRGAAAAAGTTGGGIGHLQCLTPAGAQATSTATFTTNAADLDTLTLGDGVNTRIYTFKTTPAAAGHIKIGATAAATALNLWYALVGSVTQKGIAYFAGTQGLPTTMQAAKPASNVVTFNAVLYGVAGNAYTIAKTGTNLTVSGATFASGAAGDSYVVTLQSATTSGGSYTAFMTFVSTLSQIGAERLEILPSAGTTINRFIKAIATTGGSTSKPAFNLCFAANWQN